MAPRHTPRWPCPVSGQSPQWLGQGAVAEAGEELNQRIQNTDSFLMSSLGGRIQRDQKKQGMGDSSLGQHRDPKVSCVPREGAFYYHAWTQPITRDGSHHSANAWTRQFKSTMPTSWPLVVSAVIMSLEDHPSLKPVLGDRHYRQRQRCLCQAQGRGASLAITDSLGKQDCSGPC